MKPVRRRVATTVPAEWSRDRDYEVAKWISSGLGMRPEGWWMYDSGRPDLAEDALLDPYADMRPARYLQRAKERLRYLDRTGELTDGERAAILGEQPATEESRYRWRRAVLAERVT